ncbi:MAG: TlpA family protein disulfide reductase [Acidobacteriia bacterium]|nr:TlpA family protein disulfide reductase [Terriglobia bacterium]
MSSRSPRFLLILLALTASCSTLPPEPPPPAAITNVNEEGWRAIREQQRGRVLLVNFWATWCDPCREEFPALVRLHKTYRSRGLSLVAISMDEPESVPAIEKFLQEQGAQFGSYRQNCRDFGAFVDTVNPRWGGGIPATLLFDRNGKLVESWQGATKFEEFERTVKPLLP